MSESKAEQDYIWEQLEFFDKPHKEVGLPEEVAHIEKTRISEALEQFADNRTHAAKSLGIGRTLLIHKIKKYELDKELLVN